MTIEPIDTKHPIILFKIDGQVYHWWVWRTITIAGKKAYRVTTKQNQLGWYLPCGWVSYNQLKKAIKKVK